MNVNGMPQQSLDLRAFGVLLDNHNLIAKNTADNQRVLDDIREVVNRR